MAVVRRRDELRASKIMLERAHAVENIEFVVGGDEPQSQLVAGQVELGAAGSGCPAALDAERYLRDHPRVGTVVALGAQANSPSRNGGARPTD